MLDMIFIDLRTAALVFACMTLLLITMFVHRNCNSMSALMVFQKSCWSAAADLSELRPGGDLVPNIDV